MKNQRRHQTGFTLIELIAVIVILGILAAVALPKFVGMGAEARISKMQGAMGSIKSAAMLAHATGLARNVTNGDISMEGVTVTLVNGYPNAGTIDDAAGLTGGDFVTSVANTTATITPDSSHSSCKISYTEAANNSSAPTFTADTATDLTTTNCQ